MQHVKGDTFAVPWLCSKAPLASMPGKQPGAEPLLSSAYSRRSLDTWPIPCRLGLAYSPSGGAASFGWAAWGQAAHMHIAALPYQFSQPCFTPCWLPLSIHILSSIAPTAATHSELLATDAALWGIEHSAMQAASQSSCLPARMPDCNFGHFLLRSPASFMTSPF